jgi:hypothetical protein
MDIQTLSRDARFKTKNREKLAAAAKNRRRLAKIAAMPIPDQTLAEVFADEQKKADAAALQARYDQNAKDRREQWERKRAFQEKEQADFIRDHPAEWAQSQREMARYSPGEAQRVRVLMEAGYAMGIPAIELDGLDSYTLETKLRQIAEGVAPDAVQASMVPETYARWMFKVAFALGAATGIGWSQDLEDFALADCRTCGGVYTGLKQ